MSNLALITMVTDAVSVLSALTPLIQQQITTGKPVTDEDMRAALISKDAALARLDLIIAQREAQARAALQTTAGPAL